MAVDVQRDFGYSHTEQNSHAFVTGNVQRKSSNREKLVSCHLKNNPRQKQVCGCVGMYLTAHVLLMDQNLAILIIFTINS